MKCIGWTLTGALIGYLIASGIGVWFCGASPLPYVDRIWWVPIPMVVFLVLYKFLIDGIEFE